MIRTQIQLTEDQSRRLKAAAATRGVSVSELIRQGIDSVVAGTAAPSREERLQRAIEAAGKFRSSRHDVARRHDRYLSEVFSE